MSFYKLGVRVECFWGAAMSKEDEYRDNAAKLVELSQKAQVSSDKSRLMALAEAWLDLAERVARSPIERLRRALPTADATRPEAK